MELGCWSGQGQPQASQCPRRRLRAAAAQTRMLSQQAWPSRAQAGSKVFLKVSNKFDKLLTMRENMNYNTENFETMLGERC